MSWNAHIWSLLGFSMLFVAGLDALVGPPSPQPLPEAEVLKAGNYAMRAGR